MEKKKYSVFISHSSKDGPLARRIAKQIQRTGAYVVFDAWSAKAGEPISTQVDAALRDSDEVVAVVTRNSGSSPWLSFEVGVAVGLGKRVVPILGDVGFSDLPSALSAFHAVKSDDLDRYLADLVARVKGA